jgi:hypothetical protein
LIVLPPATCERQLLIPRAGPTSGLEPTRGWRVLFAFGGPWPRAAQAERYAPGNGPFFL